MLKKYKLIFAIGVVGWLTVVGCQAPGNGKGEAAREESPASSLSGARVRAENGDAEAQKQLGLMYYVGLGVTVDYVEAYKWFQLSVSQGRDDAGQFLRRVANDMTPAQIIEAERRVADFGH